MLEGIQKAREFREYERNHRINSPLSRLASAAVGALVNDVHRLEDELESMRLRWQCETANANRLSREVDRLDELLDNANKEEEPC